MRRSVGVSKSAPCLRNSRASPQRQRCNSTMSVDQVLEEVGSTDAGCACGESRGWSSSLDIGPEGLIAERFMAALDRDCALRHRYLQRRWQGFIG